MVILIQSILWIKVVSMNILSGFVEIISFKNDADNVKNVRL